MNDQDLKEAVGKSTSICETLFYLQKARVGTNYTLIRNRVAELGLDTSHWKETRSFR